MTWTISGIDKTKPADALAVVGESNAPDCIQEYVELAIEALAAKYGEECNIKVIAHGHLFEGETSEITTAVIDVRKVD